MLYRSLVCSFLYVPINVCAQSALDSIQHIQEVVITAKPFKEVIPIQKLSGIQLEKLSAMNVADALRYFSGVQIKDFGGMGGLKTVNVRNMGSHHVGVFYDGIEVGNAQNGVVDLGKFSLDNMEEVALYNGQKSDIFQSAKDFSSASAVYMRTKRPHFQKDKDTNIQLRYRTGSIQLSNPSLQIEHRFNNNLKATVNAEHIHSNGQYKFRYKRLMMNSEVAYDTTAIRKNSDIDAYRIETAIFGASNNTSWHAKLYYYDSDRGLPGAIVKNVFGSGERQNDKNFFAQGSLISEVNEKYKFKINAKFAYDYTHYLSRDSVEFLNDYVTQKMQFDNSYYQQDVYLSTVHAYEIKPWWNASVSVDFEYNKLNATMRGVNTPFTFPQRYTTLAAIASSADLGRIKLQANVLGTFVTETVKNNVASPDKLEWAPAVFMNYEPIESGPFNFRVFYKRIFRMPTFNDLYYTQIGYSQLKPEFTDQYNLGFTYNKVFHHSFLDKIHFQSDMYYARITNKIIASPTGSSFRWMMTNMGLVETKGVDTSAEILAHVNHLKGRLNLSYSYSKAQDFTKINGLKMSSYGDQIPYTPWHSLSVIGGLQYLQWGLNYSFIYVGERYDGAVNNIERNHVEPWYTHDLSLDYSFTTNRIKWRISGEVNNLLNQYYDVVLNYPMPGRNYRLALTMNL